jgi:hypothetical protein
VVGIRRRTRAATLAGRLDRLVFAGFDGVQLLRLSSAAAIPLAIDGHNTLRFFEEIFPFKIMAGFNEVATVTGC